MEIFKKIINYEPTDKTIKEIIEELAPDIIYFNRINHWEDDNYDDILSEINYHYEYDDNELVENEVRKYLNERGL